MSEKGQMTVHAPARLLGSAAIFDCSIGSVVVALRLVFADSLWAVGLRRLSDLSCLHVRVTIGSGSSGGFAWVFHGITSPSNLPGDRPPVKG